MATMFLAAVIGWYLIIFSIFIFAKRDLVHSIVGDIINQRGLFFVIAIITLILGLLMVIGHNLWTMSWPVVVTLFGWLMLLSGLWRLFFPESSVEMMGRFLNSPNAMNIAAIIFFLIGLFLLFHVYRPYF